MTDRFRWVVEPSTTAHDTLEWLFGWRWQWRVEWFNGGWGGWVTPCYHPCLVYDDTRSGMARSVERGERAARKCVERLCVTIRDRERARIERAAATVTGEVTCG